MEVKKAGRIPYTEKQFLDYKTRLTYEILDRGLDNVTITNDSDIKDFVANYVESEINNSDKVTQRIILGITFKLAHFVLDDRSDKVYPIINEYKGHHLVRTYYFYKDIGDRTQVGVIEVIPKTIILQ